MSDSLAREARGSHGASQSKGYHDNGPLSVFFLGAEFLTIEDSYAFVPLRSLFAFGGLSGLFAQYVALEFMRDGRIQFPAHGIGNLRNVSAIGCIPASFVLIGVFKDFALTMWTGAAF